MPLPRFDRLDEPRKTSILAAAAAEFGERGFEGASYNRIIERAGISKGAMYYYFADKDDLFRTVLQTALVTWLQQVDVPIGADDAASFWRACEAMYVQSLSFVLRDPDYAALCLSVTKARSEHGHHPFVREFNQRVLEWLESVMHRGQAIGAVRDDIPADLLVHGALALIDAGDRWLATRLHELTEADVGRTAAMMVDLLRRIGEREPRS